MNITKNYLEELKQIYLDVTQDNEKTETRSFLMHFELDECKKADIGQSELFEKAKKTSVELAMSFNDSICDSLTSHEMQGFLMGFIYAKELLR